MHQVTIKPQWTIRRPHGGALPARVIELLVQVADHGSLSAACQVLGISYRHAWDSIRQAEAAFGDALLVMERGKGSTLTPLGDKLVWADRRIAARLSPVLDSLASELGAEIAKLLAPGQPLLRIQANHGFGIEALHTFLSNAAVATEFKYCGSVEAVAALRGRACDVAGFPVPMGEFEAEVLRHYRPWLDPASQRIVHVCTRRQGLMLAAGNPLKIYDVADLARPGVRFVNRQPGSGTRLLLDLLLQRRGLAQSRIVGYEQCELTHAAVAAAVASGLADAGYGVETPARQFRLEFVANQIERYVFVCNTESLRTPAVETLLATLRSDEFRAAVDRLAGYQADGAGQVMALDEAFESLRG